MSEAFRGQGGSGSTVAYTVPLGHSMRLELLTFQLDTSNVAGVHSALVTFTDPTINQITARIWDWNEGGANMTLFYTYGIGLRPFNCTVTNGMMIPNNLPETELVPETLITVEAVDVTCSVIAGDVISGVVLYGELIDEVGGNDPASSVRLIGGLLPGSVSG
jgi:hypothetical protein